MDCLISQLNLELDNDNLPSIDLRIPEYMAALGDNTHKAAVTAFYDTLKTGNVIDKFDVIMPILGSTVDKAVLNLMDVNKPIAYNGAIQVGANSIFADSAGERVAGGFEDIEYYASDIWSIMCVFKRSNTHKGLIFGTDNARNMIGQPDSNYWSLFGDYKSLTGTGSDGNVYLGTLTFIPWGSDPTNKFNYSYMLGTDKSSIQLESNRSVTPANTFTSPMTLFARPEIYFFSIMKNVQGADYDVILPAIKTFIEATKDVTFAPNP